MVASSAVVAPTPAQAATGVGPGQDPFYTYSGAKPLAQIPPGTVLNTRTVTDHVANVPLPVQAVQLLYRSTGAVGQPTTNVTSVLEPPLATAGNEAVSYQSFYDSLNPNDEPSVQIANGSPSGPGIADVETLFYAQLLLAGVPVVVSDTEGQSADFAAGPEYGYNTLDSMRAVDNSPVTGLNRSTKMAMLGYSGGAIATEWASQLAPGYAPDVNQQLVGAAEGGVLVDPAHNLNYISGTALWSGVMPMSLIGLARAFHVDLTPYLSAYGQQVYAQNQSDSISAALGHYPGLTFAQLVKPQYANPDSIPAYVQLANKINAGLAPSPTTPMFIGQGANGILEGTPGDKAGIGAGDAVMIAGDVRSLARQYCASGDTVNYNQYDLTSHTTSVPLWAPAAISWIESRFAGQPAPNNCAQIAPGNSLAPERPAP